MGGIRSHAILETKGTDVQVIFRFNIPTALWQIHELPVDYSIDPKLRCRPEHTGQFLQHGGANRGYIYDVTTASLIMHSMVIVFEGEPAACGTVVPDPSAFFYSFAFAELKSGLFGKMYISQWPSEHI